jgi:hypothetical protein
LDAGLCDGNNEDHLNLEETLPGNPAPPVEEPAPQNPSPDYPQPGVPSDPNAPQQPAEPPSPADPDGGGWQCIDPEGGLLGGACGLDAEEPEVEEPEAPAAPERPAIPPEIDQRDVASFMPQATQPTIEPFGVAIKNAPMNVAFSVEPHTIGGNLFDLPVDVTFTPDIVTIDYGDGTQTRVSGSAATWDGLGQQQLTPTATSHTYGERGRLRAVGRVSGVRTHRLLRGGHGGSGVREAVVSGRAHLSGGSAGPGLLTE